MPGLRSTSINKLYSGYIFQGTVPKPSRRMRLPPLQAPSPFHTQPLSQGAVRSCSNGHGRGRGHGRGHGHGHGKPVAVRCSGQREPHQALLLQPCPCPCALPSLASTLRAEQGERQVGLCPSLPQLDLIRAREAAEPQLGLEGAAGLGPQRSRVALRRPVWASSGPARPWYPLPPIHSCPRRGPRWPRRAWEGPLPPPKPAFTFLHPNFNVLTFICSF